MPQTLNTMERVTAGLRGAHWDPSRLPADTTLTTHGLRTEDGAMTTGFLFRRGQEKAVVCLMHPREILVSHYLVPDILLSGAAVWVQAPRSPGNDLRLEHEIALYDVAAGQRFLRANGFSTVVLLGNSGGAGLYALYNHQSLADPAKRLEATPGGRPTRLEKADLPPADALILVSPHPGQGKLLMSSIDPSVSDEDDPLVSIPELDPFSTSNGFKEPPESAGYSPAFVQNFRAAQKLRVAKLDAKAKSLIEARQTAKAKLRTADADKVTCIKAAHTAIMTVWRTDADLRCYDLSLDPSDRRYGSLWGQNPFVSNWGAVGFGRICTPESWLSTWSGLSSRASFEHCGPAIEQPTLLIEYTGDNCVFPPDIDEIFSSIGTGDKLRCRVPGDHHGRALGEGGESGQILAGRLIQNWLCNKVI